MPIYEFKCCGCGHQFEALVRASDPDVVACPACQSQNLERVISLFAAKSEDRSKSAFKAAKQKAAKAHREAQSEELQHAMKEHDDHH